MTNRLYKLLEFILFYNLENSDWGVMKIAKQRVLYISSEWAESAAEFTGFVMDELTESAGYWFFDDGEEAHND